MESAIGIQQNHFNRDFAGKNGKQDDFLVTPSYERLSQYTRAPSLALGLLLQELCMARDPTSLQTLIMQLNSPAQTGMMSICCFAKY